MGGSSGVSGNGAAKRQQASRPHTSIVAGSKSDGTHGDKKPVHCQSLMSKTGLGGSASARSSPLGRWPCRRRPPGWPWPSSGCSTGLWQQSEWFSGAHSEAAAQGCGATVMCVVEHTAIESAQRSSAGRCTSRPALCPLPASLPCAIPHCPAPHPPTSCSHFHCKFQPCSEPCSAHQHFLDWMPAMAWQLLGSGS